MRKPILALMVLSVMLVGCGKKEPKPVVTEPTPAPKATDTPATTPPPTPSK